MQREGGMRLIDHGKDGKKRVEKTEKKMWEIRNGNRREKGGCEKLTTEKTEEKGQKDGKENVEILKLK